MCKTASVLNWIETNKVKTEHIFNKTRQYTVYCIVLLNSVLLKKQPCLMQYSTSLNNSKPRDILLRSRLSQIQGSLFL